MGTNLPQTLQKGIINKIKSWFMRIKGNKKAISNEEIIPPNNDTTINDKPKEDFLADIAKQTNVSAMTLQEKIKLGKIRAADLSDEEYKEVIELYDAQIVEMSNKLEKYKEKIAKLRKV